MVSSYTPETKTWRPTPVLRFAALAYVVLSIVLGVSVIAIAAGEGAVLQGVGFVGIFFWIPGVIGLRYAFRTRIEAANRR